MRATVYLFRTEAASFDELLREFPEGSRAPEQRDLADGLDMECEVWIMPQEPRPPTWLKYVTSLANLSDLRNSTSSVAILFKAGDRFFAVCFGYSQSMLNHELLEPEFGLRVTANMADPEKIAAMQVRTLSENSRQQRSQTANKSRVADFDLEVEREWLRYLKADVTAGVDWANGVGGSQSLSLTTDHELAEFPSILSALLSEFESDSYKGKFPYIDNFTPIAKGDPVLDDLWTALIEAIKQPDGKKIGVASPDDLLGADVASWKIFGDGKRGRAPVEELSFSSIVDQIDVDKLEADREKLKIVPLNVSDEAIRTKRPLTDYFVFEFDSSGETYALCLGQWFQISSDYVAEINERISRIEDITDSIRLPAWKSGKEGEYNERVCKQFGYIHLDAKNFSIGGPHQKIEVCDFITPDFDFVCVKKMEDSATMSHLFSQAAVSADLYFMNAQGQGANSTGYADHIKSLYKQKWGTVDTVEAERRMVLAIATEKPGPIASSLFFFSKVNLAQRVEDLRKSAFRVAIAKIAR
ncbi:TIGR04141 family sporadically distributed protein [Streptomyces antibioticus]|uniref:TIGR04141 family sporadically distributed protein n=1 Tax=Streptomyces antibioticus TaxID=1890 RepID=A0AAE7CLZ4_STRAT|nr:TIGR04141 family sporadically distributed protein [Streptomyces antibioticus]QIT46100.1 TIGR04141 family sporadically distributed protein [Streptomyces antibioticus]